MPRRRACKRLGGPPSCRRSGLPRAWPHPGGHLPFGLLDSCLEIRREGHPVLGKVIQPIANLLQFRRRELFQFSLDLINLAHAIRMLPGRPGFKRDLQETNSRIRAVDKVVAQVSKPAVSPISNRQGVGMSSAPGLRTACGFGNPRYSRFGNLRYAGAPGAQARRATMSMAPTREFGRQMDRRRQEEGAPDYRSILERHQPALTETTRGRGGRRTKIDPLVQGPGERHPAFGPRPMRAAVQEEPSRQALGQAALHEQRRRTQQQRADRAPARQFFVPEQ